MLPNNQHIRRRRGGQPGNQNARKHGYYSSALAGRDKTNLNQASQVIGLDDEIALLRSRLKSVVENDPDNIRLISEAASTLARLMRTVSKLGLNKQQHLEEVRWKFMSDTAIEFGLDMNKVAALYLGNTKAFMTPDPLKQPPSFP